MTLEQTVHAILDFSFAMHALHREIKEQQNWGNCSLKKSSNNAALFYIQGSIFVWKFFCNS